MERQPKIEFLDLIGLSKLDPEEVRLTLALRALDALDAEDDAEPAAPA